MKVKCQNIYPFSFALNPIRSDPRTPSEKRVLSPRLIDSVCRFFPDSSTVSRFSLPPVKVNVCLTVWNERWQPCSWLVDFLKEQMRHAWTSAPARTMRSVNKGQLDHCNVYCGSLSSQASTKLVEIPFTSHSLDQKKFKQIGFRIEVSSRSQQQQEAKPLGHVGSVSSSLIIEAGINLGMVLAPVDGRERKTSGKWMDVYQWWNE